MLQDTLAETFLGRGALSAKLCPLQLEVANHMTQPYNNYQSYLAHAWTEMMAESRFLRGKSVRVPLLLEAYFIIFQTGAVLGRANADRGVHFTTLFAEPGQAETLVSGFREMGEEGRIGMLAYAEGSPSINPFFTFSLAHVHAALGIGGSAEEVLRHPDKRISAGRAAQVLAEAATLGVSLGFTFPELVKELWSEHYESVERDPLLEVLRRRAGLTEREGLPLDEVEQQALSALATFAQEYYPELIEPLGLGEHVE